MLDLVAAGGGWHHTEMARMKAEVHPSFLQRVRMAIGDSMVPVIVIPDAMAERRAEVKGVFPEATVIGEENGRICAKAARDSLT